MSLPHPLPLLAQLLYCECMQLLRLPSFTIPTFVVPIVLYACIGLPLHGRAVLGLDGAGAMLAAISAYITMTTALFAVGGSIAFERARGWLCLLQRSPLPIPVWLSAKLLLGVCQVTISLALLYGFARLCGVPVSPTGWLQLYVAMIGGMAPFVLLGLAIGFRMRGEAAITLINLVFLPLSFASGLFMPLQQLPEWMRDLAPLLPPFHLANLGWAALGAQVDPPLQSIAALAAYGLGFLPLLWLAPLRRR
ncbi:ABC transporter permease [Chitiniphilus purpureus]|uniref:ABC transporter permease n=1 Tax=Chitiniphilus purpureus TaxID=2981137 RepID=A0ABY6DT73_9NEIS|nr:ABC transporter permease [Chitiniphilus sp. CD1]UXY15058.1 ABC transporter permease [Chitiniphilus sp. CD1]